MTRLSALLTLSLFLASPLLGQSVQAQSVEVESNADEVVEEATVEAGEVAQETTEAAEAAAESAAETADDATEAAEARAESAEQAAQEAQEEAAEIQPVATIQAVAQESEEASGAAGEQDGEGAEEGETLSAAERAASVTGGQGLPWVFPISWTHNLSVRTLAPNSQLTYNPFYSWSFAASPRWIFSPVFSIGARMTLDVELTDSNSTVEPRDLEWGDLQLDATFALPWRPGGISISPTIALRLPTSNSSRGQSRALGPTVRLLLIKPWSVLQGLVTGVSMGLTGWVHHDSPRLRAGTAGADFDTALSTTPGFQLADGGGDFSSAYDRVCRTIEDGESSTSGRNCIGSNQTRIQFSLSLFASLIPVKGFAINLSYAWIYLRRGQLADQTIGRDQGVITENPDGLQLGDNSRQHHTHISQFSLGVSYDFTPYFTMGLSYNTLAFYPDSDGSLENFFYNENSQFSLSLQFRPAALVRVIRQNRDEEQSTEAAEAANNAVESVTRYF